MNKISELLKASTTGNVIALISLMTSIVFAILALPSGMKPNVYCPPLLSKDIVNKWQQAGEVHQSSIGSFINEFDQLRGIDGGFRNGDILPEGVFIITAFADRGDTLIYQVYDVQPVVHYRSHGVFRTTQSFKTDFPGACLALSNPSPSWLAITSVFSVFVFVIMSAAPRLPIYKRFFPAHK